MRGRYGHGPMGGGLLKKDRAKRDPRALIQLYMPAETPVPTPTVGELHGKPQIPLYGRRSHHTWAWENRQIYVSTNGLKLTTSKIDTQIRDVPLGRRWQFNKIG